MAEWIRRHRTASQHRCDAAISGSNALAGSARRDRRAGRPTDFLDVHDNRLTRLPDAIARLTRLQYLNAGDNQLAALPEEIGAMAGARRAAHRAQRADVAAGVDRPARRAARAARHQQPPRGAARHDRRSGRACARSTLRGNRLRRLPASMARLSRLLLARPARQPARGLAGGRSPICRRSRSSICDGCDCRRRRRGSRRCARAAASSTCNGRTTPESFRYDSGLNSPVAMSRPRTRPSSMT